MLYYDNLTRVRTDNDLSQWFKFFLTGVIETAKSGVTTFDSIMQLQKTLDVKLKTLGNRSVDARLVIESLYVRLVIDVNRIESIIAKSNVSAYKLIASLEQLEILQEITGGQRGRLYIFKDYVDLFKTAL